ncbi:MAG: hypothetical protein Q7S44_00785 [bacterium]|nr:hypothetical protein [bacterium]
MLTAEIFLRELKRIVLSQPKLASHILYSENCQYGDFIFWCKNLQFCFDNANCNDSVYLYDNFMSANSIDCDYSSECELCYECVDAVRCFNCSYIEYSGNLQDSDFCYNCDSNHHLFGCVNLSNKSYCIFNRQLTEDEYNRDVQKFKTLSPEKNLQSLEELIKMFPKIPTKSSKNENSDYSNYTSHSKDCYLCFDTYQETNCAYTYDSAQNSNCLDFTYSYQSELSYEVVDSDEAFNCSYLVYTGKCQDSNYLFNCQNCQYCLGCAGLSHQKYCLLNRQLTKEEYEKVSTQILQDLKEKNLSWSDLVF